MNIEDLIRNEQTILRAEIQELKRCQLSYFLTAVAGAGAILGLGDSFSLSDETKIFAFLAPLVIVIPCWVTFFDKATTITRLAGYIRVAIEEQSHSPLPQYVGYETALARFRKEEEKNPSVKTARPPNREASSERPPRHRYWMINWLTFCVLGLLSCALPIFFCWTESKTISWWLVGLDAVAFTVFLVSAIFTWRIVRDLMYGKYSYENVATYWRGFLFSNRKEPST